MSSHTSRFKVKFNTLLVTALMGVFGIVGCASTNSAPKHSRLSDEAKTSQLFQALDTNHDGSISEEEMKRALEMLTEEGRMESTQMVYGLKASGARETPVDKLKHLSAAQKKKLIDRAFHKKDSPSAADDQHRISEDDFKKIVIGPQTSNDSRSDDDSIELEPNPWQKLL